MKKRMLITTIVMVVVLALALTTSSLAWFTAAQSSVTATGGQFTAQAASSSNISIGVNTDGGTRWYSTAALTQTNTSNLQALVPTAKLNTCLDNNTDLPATLTDVNSIAMNGANVMYNDSNVQVFPLDDSNKHYTASLGGTGCSQAQIYVSNLDPVSQLHQLTVEIEVESATKTNAVPVFYVVLADTSSNVLRAAVLGFEDKYIAYKFVDGTSVEVSTVAAATQDVTAKSSETFGENAKVSATFSGLEWVANGIYQLWVYAWYQGDSLSSSTAGAETSYKLNLSAAQ